MFPCKLRPQGKPAAARAALAHVSDARPDFEDRISYFEKCMANAEAIMLEAYSMKHDAVERVWQKWQKVGIEESKASICTYIYRVEP
jgi:hypothetical protein